MELSPLSVEFNIRGVCCLCCLGQESIAENRSAESDRFEDVQLLESPLRPVQGEVWNLEDVQLGESPLRSAQGEVWNLEDVQLQIMEENEAEESPPHCAASSRAAVPEPSASVIDPEERALLNMLSFEPRGPRGVRWGNSPQKASRDASKATDQDKAKRRARLECRTSGMLEKLQHCLTRAESKAAVSAHSSLKTYHGKCYFPSLVNRPASIKVKSSWNDGGWI